MTDVENVSKITKNSGICPERKKHIECAKTDKNMHDGQKN